MKEENDAELKTGVKTEFGGLKTGLNGVKTGLNGLNAFSGDSESSGVAEDARELRTSGLSLLGGGGGGGGGKDLKSLAKVVNQLTAIRA